MCHCNKCRSIRKVEDCPYRELSNRLFLYGKFKLTRKSVADTIIKYIHNGDVDIVNSLVKPYPELVKLVDNILLLI